MESKIIQNEPEHGLKSTDHRRVRFLPTGNRVGLLFRNRAAVAAVVAEAVEVGCVRSSAASNF